MVRKIHIIPAGIVLVALAAGPVYKWVDEQGVTHYSDQPPAQDQEAEEIELLPAPAQDEVLEAQARLDRLMAKQQTSREKRAAERERERLQRELEEAQRVNRLRRCMRARQNLHSLQQPRPVYSINEEGEFIYLDDSERLAEMQRLRSQIDDYCD